MDAPAHSEAGLGRKGINWEEKKGKEYGFTAELRW